MTYVTGALNEGFCAENNVNFPSAQLPFTLQDLCLKTLEQPLLQLENKIDRIEKGEVIFPWKCTSVFLKSIFQPLIDSCTLPISKFLLPAKEDKPYCKKSTADLQGAKKIETSVHCTVLDAIEFCERSDFTLDQIKTELLNCYMSGVQAEISEYLERGPNKTYQQYMDVLHSIELQEKQFLEKEKAKIAREFLVLKTQHQTSFGTTLSFEGARMEKMFQHLSEAVLKMPIKEQLELWPDFLNVHVLPLLQKYVVNNSASEFDTKIKEDFCAQLPHTKREFEFFVKGGDSTTCKWLNDEYFLLNLSVESILSNPELIALKEHCAFTEELCDLFEVGEFFVE